MSRNAAYSSIHRREFLLAGCAGLAAGSIGFAEPVRMASPLKLGFSLYGMRTLALERALRTCREIGYEAVELAAMGDWPADPRRLGRDERRTLRTLLGDLNLSLAGVMENVPEDGDEKRHRANMERLAAAAELAHDLAPKNPPILETILGGRVGQWDMLRQRFADRLADWARLGEKTRTVFAFKPHRMQALNLPEQAAWLVGQVKSPWVKLVYDWSHFQHRDLAMEATLRALLPHAAAFVHVKDVRVEKGRVRFLLPGDGDVDYVALFRGLVGHKWQGCVCVEVSGMIWNQKGYDPVAAARRSFRHLADARRKAGS